MKNLGQMLKQAQDLQSKMGEMQEEMAAMEVTGQSGGGMCQVTLNGKGAALRLSIDPSLVNPEDTDVLEDLLLAAINDARNKTDQRVREKMSQMTGGLELPAGMNLPF